MNIFFAQTSARMVQLLREIAGAGMIMQPSENDFVNPEFRPYLDKYMRGKDVKALSKARLLRLAHDLAISSFGMRQELYEYWHGGDPNRNRINLLRSYDQSDMMDRIKALLSRPLAHGEMSPPSRTAAS
jgi:aromatic ring hydroxylase